MRLIMKYKQAHLQKLSRYKTLYKYNITIFAAIR